MMSLHKICTTAQIRSSTRSNLLEAQDGEEEKWLIRSSAYMARDVQLPTLIREKRGFNKFTLADVIRKMEEHLITIKESKLSQEMSKMHE
jgi:hypothetical protein